MAIKSLANQVELAVSSTATIAFLKCLYVLVQYYYLDDKEFKPLQAVVKQSSALAQDFVKTFGIDKKLFDVSVKAAAANSHISDTIDEAVYDLADTTRDIFEKFQKDTSISKEHLDLLLDLLRWLMTESDIVYKRLEKKVSILNDMILTRSFIKDSGKQGPVIVKLKKIVKTLTGKNDSNISPEDRAKVKKKSPELFSTFLKLRQEFVAVFKDALRNLVRGSGKPFLPYDQVLTYLKSKNIQHTLPVGFVGNVDENGVLYTTTGNKINGVPMGATVQMNPKYVPEQDNAYVFNSVPGTGFATTALRYYTVNYKAKSTGEKWEHVGDFIPIVENLVKKWTAMMKGSDRKALMALMLVTMYLTQMRASAKEGNAKGATTYGLTTLLVKHVKNLKGKVRLFYPGKDNVTQTHDIPQNTVLNKMVGQRILALAKNRKPTDRLWSMDDKPCNYAELYTFFKSQVPPGITMHKIRHVTGTRMAKEIFDNSPLLKKKEVTQTEAEAWVKTALTQVGAKLGHIQGQKVTPMTAIKNYISPPLIVEFFEKLKLRSPTWVPVAEK